MRKEYKMGNFRRSERKCKAKLRWTERILGGIENTITSNTSQEMLNKLIQEHRVRTNKASTMVSSKGK